MKAIRMPLLLILPTLLISCGGGDSSSSSVSQEESFSLKTSQEESNETLSSIIEASSSEDEVTAKDFIDVLFAAENSMRTKVNDITVVSSSTMNFDGEIDEDHSTTAISRKAKKAYREGDNTISVFAPNAYEGHHVNYSYEKSSGEGSYRIWATYCGEKDIENFEPLPDFSDSFPYLALYDYLDEYFTILLPFSLLEYGVFGEDDNYFDFTYETAYSLKGTILDDGLSLVIESSVSAASNSNAKRHIELTQTHTFLYNASFISSIEIELVLENAYSALLKERVTMKNKDAFSRAFDSDKFDEYLAIGSSMTPWGGDVNLRFSCNGLRLTLYYDYTYLDTRVSVSSLISKLNDKLASDEALYRVTSISKDGETLWNSDSIALSTTNWIYLGFHLEAESGYAYVCEAYEEPFDFPILFEEQEAALSSLLELDMFEASFDYESTFIEAGDSFSLHYNHDGYTYGSALINGEEATKDSFIAANRGQ